MLQSKPQLSFDDYQIFKVYDIDEYETRNGFGDNQIKAGELQQWI